MGFHFSAHRNNRYQTEDFVRSASVHETRFGDNHAVGTTEEDVWRGGGLYNWIGTPAQLKVSSSSAQDAAAGTGARTVTLIGLDSNWATQTETVTLTGQTAVTTTSTWKRINRAYCSGTVGTGLSNAGTIYVHNSAVTNGVPDDLTKLYAQIDVGAGDAMQAVHSTADEYEEGLSSIVVSAGRANDDATIVIYVREDGGPWVTLRHYEMHRQSFRESNGCVIVLPSRCDLRVAASAATSSVAVSAALHIHKRSR